ncbi:hypothetical protein PIB30_016647 [Stylosanthes scabra]|uniref:RecA family profile 1 domain-containing protein n=1 Tax=Stylosanthes scabra TaxID=79078 RepID=A0ABU6W6T1_9FABA|nr:hypothetical protein [Stylosanthes scabra]
MQPQKLLHLPTHKCTVGCPLLDRFLAGGIPCNSITEIVAENATGKTQFCLQLVLYAQLPPSRGGLSASSLYIHTEFPFPLRRLRQLSRAFRSSHPDHPVADPCDRVFVQGVYTADELVDAIPKIELFLIHSRSRFPLRVIVIDSIAALFRSDFDNTVLDLRRRSSLFFKIAGGLKSLAKRFGVAVVVTNQVVDLIEGEKGNSVRAGNLSALYSSGRPVVPALGLAWANCVNSRLFLSREDDGDADVDGSSRKKRRRITVVFAPHLPHSSSEFVITTEGVFGR